MASAKTSRLPDITEDVVEELRAEHRALDQQLSQLQRHIALSPAEQVELVRLKKLKLAAKDRLARMARL